MNPPSSSHSYLRRIVLPVLVLASLALSPAVGVALAATPHESLQEYEKQLAAGEISSVKINKFVRHVDITLKDGTKLIYVYPPKDEPAIASALAAKHIAVEVLSPTAAKSEAKKAPVKHKLRYIAGGILIVVVIVVGAVLVIDRRRKAAME